MTSCLSNPQGCLPRAGADHQGVHAGGDHHRPPLAGGVFTCLLQSVRPNAPQQAEETTAPRAPVQPLRGAQRLENLSCLQAALMCVTTQNKNVLTATVKSEASSCTSTGQTFLSPLLDVSSVICTHCTFSPQQFLNYPACPDLVGILVSLF